MNLQSLSRAAWPALAAAPQAGAVARNSAPKAQQGSAATIHQGSAPVAVRVQGIRKRYGSKVVLKGVDLEVCRGEVFGLLGSNGAGKTTLLEIVEGFREADAGQVEVLGGPVRGRLRAEVRARIGMQVQEMFLPDRIRVVEALQLYRSCYPAGQSVEELLALAGLEQMTTAFYEQLSGGQKRRLALALALAGDPELLILDEPTSAADPRSRRQVWDLVEGYRRRGRTVILATHALDEAERLCDRVAVLDEGRILALGEPRKLVEDLGLGTSVAVRIEPGPYGPVREGWEQWMSAELLGPVRWEGDACHLRCREPGRLVRELARHLDGRTRWELLSVRPATLEDAYLQLTGKEMLLDGSAVAADRH